MAKGNRSQAKNPQPERGSGGGWRAAGLDRRGLLWAVGAAAFLAVLLTYAGPAATEVIYRLLTDGVLLLVWLLAAAGLGSVVPLPAQAEKSPEGSGSRPAAPTLSDSADEGGLEARPCERPSGVLRFVTAAALGLGFFSLCALGLGLAGWLNRASALTLIAAGLAAGLLRLARARGAGAGASFRHWLNAPAGWGWLWLLATPFLAIMVIGALVPPGVLWGDEPHGYDVVEYHLQAPREWYEAGRIEPLRHNVFSFFPFNVEMHYLLAMHLRGGPWAGMFLAQLMHAAFVVLTVAAVYGLASAPSAARDRAAATLAGVAAATVPWMPLLGAVAYNEGGLLLYGALAAGWALRGVRATGRGRTGAFLLGGAMAGFACGAKLTGVPTVLLAVPAAAVLVVAVASRFRRKSAGPVLAGGILFGVAGVLVFSPWLMRNVRWAGNPVFPEAMPLLGRGHFNDEQVERWAKAHSARPEQKRWLPSADAPGRFGQGLRQILADWRFGYLLIPTAIVAALVGRRERGSQFLAVLLAMLAVFWLGFTHLQGRFFVLAIPLGALLVGRAEWGRWKAAPAAAIAAGALVGWASLHGRLMELDESLKQRTGGQAGVFQVLGFEGLDATPQPPAASIGDASTLVLVGDAAAFNYKRPMARLRYRTVFDVATGDGKSVIDAWTDGIDPAAENVLWVDPTELQRFHKTYAHIPPLPDTLPGPRDRPFDLRK